MALYTNMKRFLLIPCFSVLLLNSLYAQSVKNLQEDTVLLKGNHSNNSFFDQTIRVPFSKSVQRRYTTSSVSSVSGDALKHINTPFLSNTLYGQLSGLYVQQGGGSPGDTD